MKRRTGSAATLVRQTAELGLAVPQVMAHRLTRMALAGSQPSPRDQREFQRMVAEKQAAFGQSWLAMSAQSLLAGQSMAASMLGSMWAPWLGRKVGSTLATQWHGAALDVLGKGLAPVHRKAVANSKRLARTRLR